MRVVTIENRKLNPALRTHHQVIITDATGTVVLVSKPYAKEAAALARAEKETATSQVPALYATIADIQD